MFASKSDAGSDVVFARRFGKPAGGAADLEGGVGGQRYVLKELHLPSRYIRSGAQAYALAEPGASLYNQEKRSKEQACTPRLWLSQCGKSLPAQASKKRGPLRTSTQHWQSQ